jgi:hypothetical protein
MTSTPATTLERFCAAELAVGELPSDAAAYSALTEAELLEANRRFAAAQVVLRGAGALIAGEIAKRSAPELGMQGLAQRAGHRTPEQFVKATTGVPGRDAVTAVRVGSLMREAATDGQLDQVTGEIATPSQPWLSPVTDALGKRALSIEAAEAIRAGLGAPNSVISTESLRDAAAQLCAAAKSLDPDALAREARAFRDELDVDGVALREQERRAKRSLRLFVQPDGTTKLVWVMDTETAAIVKDLYDRATSPKRGGVRFVDPQRQQAAEAILADERTVDQVASDGFVQLLQLGADADPKEILGSGAPVVYLTVPNADFQNGHGVARIEAETAPVSVATASRMACGGTVIPVMFDASGTKLDFGREHRFFTTRQKRALALIWGGCAFPGCTRPPSWCEAHHIRHWARDTGRTDLVDGIPLCRHHHLLCHDNGWEIRRDENSRYWLIPPPDRDPEQKPIELVSKSRLLRDLQRQSNRDVTEARAG